MSVLSTVCVVAGPICSVGQSAASTAAGAVSGGILNSIASEFSSAEGEMLKLLLSAWVNVPSPSLSSTTGTVGFLQSSLSWYVAGAAVLGVLPRKWKRSPTLAPFPGPVSASRLR